MSDPVRTSDDPQPVDLDADDAERLSRIAISRGEGAREVISSLLREADRPAA